MNILTIGSDRKLFEERSAVKRRILLYGALCDELHIIVFSRRSHELKEEQIADNIWLYPTNSRSRMLYIRDAVRIGKALKAIDVVTTQDPFEAGLAGYLLSKKLTSILHIQIHTDFLNPYFTRRSLLNWIRVRIAHFVIPRAQCIRVVSKHIRQSIKNQFSLSFEPTVLPIFVPVREFREGEPKRDIRKEYTQFDFLILIVSRLEKEKNIQLALDMMVTVTKLHPKVGLLVVGEGKERVNLEKQIVKNHLEGNALLLGWQSDVLSYYKGADLLLVTSDYEGYGMVMVEAVAAGLDVLSTDVGIARDIGAMIMDRKKISKSVSNYISQGGKSSDIKHYIYKDRKEYIEAYVRNIRECVK